jgi:hypothetical protein
MEKGKEKTFEKKVLRKFLQKLAPCIKRGDLDACVEEAVRVAGEMGVDCHQI